MKVHLSDPRMLADAVGWTAKTLPARPAVPVLAGIRLAADDTGLQVCGYDYEASTAAAVPAEVSESGAVLVSGRLLADIVKALPARPVELAAAGTHLELVCGSARFTLPTMPLEDYPVLPGLPEAAGEVDAGMFAQAVAQVAVAAGRDETLPMMTGVRIELAGDRLALLATDRYRLAVRDLPWRPAGPGVDAAALVPAKTLTDTAKALAAAGTITLGYDPAGHGEGVFGFAGTGRQATSRLLDGANYPPVRSLFPTRYAAAATVNVADLLEVVKRVALVADRAAPVLLGFDGDTLTVQAGGSEAARASEATGAAFTGEPLTIGFNPQYLIDGLASVGTARAVLSFVDAFKPAVICPAGDDNVPDGSYRYLLMPIRVTR